MRRSNKKGIVPMALGILLIIGALVLTGYNLWNEYQAGLTAQKLVQLLPEPTENPEENAADVPALEDTQTDTEQTEDMPVMDIDGTQYIGKLYIYDLGLELPVRSELTYRGLVSAPCRYKGSVYEDNMIIAAHNYRTHFGNIHKLTQGSRITFVDIEGRSFDYVLDTIETIDGRNIEQMESGDWDLSLFTCNYRGNARITLRCKKTENLE